MTARSVSITAACALLAGVAGVTGARAQEDGAARAAFYVSPDGNDDWSGKLAEPNPAATDGPFATLQRAQQALRQGGADARTVLIRGGTYRLTEPIAIAPEDSGTPEAPVTYAAYPGEKPIFSGGRAITGWRKGEGDLWVATVPEVAAGEWYFRQLFVNAERRTRARTPNQGYLRTDGPLPEFPDPHAERANPEAKMGFRYKEGDLRSWDDLGDVNLFVYHSWTASVHWIDDLDEENRTVRFTNRSGWPIGYWDRTQRYYVENHREALDSPGEWCLDRKTGALLYWPLPGEDMDHAEVVAPLLRTVVRFAGEPELGMTVRHVTLRGLSFEHTEWAGEKTQTLDGQAAAVHTEAAVMLDGAHNCTIEDCEIAHVGEYGLWLRRGCRDNLVRRCELHDLGAGGVRIGETISPRAEPHASLRNVIDNNFIHDGGHVFRAGIGVWIGRSSYHEVTHNDICDFDYTGVSVGWSWGYAESSANHNRIEYNHIHHIGHGVLSDMGAIYCLGLSPGTTLRNNLIHDIHSYAYGGWGLYTDEGSTDILMENNVVYDTKTGGFHQHYGRENILRNNILAFSRQGQIIRSRQEEHISFTFEGNIVLTDNGLPLGGNWANDNFRIDRNIYWDTVSGDDLDFSGLEFEEWQAGGHDQDSIVDDPLFVDAAGLDFRLKPGSPALKMGFEPIDVGEIGLYGDPEWVGRPKAIQRPESEIPRAPPPSPIVDDFEDTEVGEQPKVDQISGEDLEKGGSVRVTDETAATGQRSLKFTDAPGLSREWQPHIYYTPSFRSGVLHCAFDVRVDEGAIFWHEWRDRANPYRVGPSIRIEPSGELKAGGKTLLTVPLGEWMHLDIDCGLGKDSTGTYRLSITLPDGEENVFDDVPLGNPKFKRLQWLGFISLATDTAAFYIDNLQLSPVNH